MTTQTFAPTQAHVRKSKFSLTVGIQYAICTLVALIVFVPLWATVMGGLKDTGELMANPFGLPAPPRIENYTSILTGREFWMQMGNSLWVLLGSVVVSLVASAMAAFVFARLSFRGRDALFNFINLGLLFPLAVAILPLYIQLRNMGLLDSLPGVFLPQAAFSLPTNILILRNFFRSIPAELEDAAYIDGCTTAGFFWRILLPLARPALATVAVLVMVASWNNFLLPLLVLNNQSLWTLPMGVMKFSGERGIEWGPILAFVTLALLPAIALYLLAQRQLIAGLTSGAVKG
jgi:raffinose/stachyose/melibiose transport system permease protein